MLGSTENSISQRSSHQSRLQPQINKARRLQPQINKARNQGDNLKKTILSHPSS